MARTRTATPRPKPPKPGGGKKAPSPVQAILAEVARLTPRQRQELLARLEMLYVEPPITEIPDWQKAILKERLAEAEANPDAGIPWEEHLKIFDQYQ